MATTFPTVKTLDLDFDAGWLAVWLNQPDKRNALTDGMRADLVQVFKAVRDDRAVRGITLRGRGGVFCAGGDLKQFKTQFQSRGDEEEIRAMSREAAEIFDLVNSAPQVVICLIEGAAMAGGFGLACCADVVICEAHARFAMTETMIGLSPAQIAPFVIQKLGLATARRLMLTAARFDGRGARDLGFADFVGEDVAEVERVERDIKTQVLKCAPGAIAGAKELILSLPNLDRGQAIEAAAENFKDRMISDEAREGIAAFFEKRKPAWAQGDDGQS